MTMGLGKIKEIIKKRPRGSLFKNRIVIQNEGQAFSTVTQVRHGSRATGRSEESITPTYWILRLYGFLSEILTQFPIPLKFGYILINLPIKPRIMAPGDKMAPIKLFKGFFLMMGYLMSQYS